MEFLERLVDALPDAVCVVDSISKKIKYFNKTFSTQLLAGDHLIGADFAHEVLNFEDTEKYDNAFEAALSKYEDVTVGFCKSLSHVGPEKFPLYKAFFWVMRRLDDNNILLRGNLDTAKYSIPESPEIFDYSAELMDFFQNAPIALHWLSGTGHILWANNLELETLGYTREEYIGKHIMQFCPDEEKALTTVFAELSDRKTIRNAPFKFRTKSGDIKYLIVDSNVNWNPDGTFKHTRCFIRDDSERRMREAVKDMELKTLRAAAQGKDRFVRRIFHELKTPLHVISGSACELSEELVRIRGGHAALGEVTGIQHHIDSMLGTLDDVSFSIQFDEGRSIQPRPCPTDISALLGSVAAGVEAIESRSGQRVQFQMNSGSVPRYVEADASLQKVLFHLLRNAVRFSPDEAQVHVNVVFSEVDTSGGKRRREESQAHSALQVPSPIIRLGTLSIAVTNSVREPVDLVVINQSFRNYYSMAPSFGDRDCGLTSVQGIGLGLYVAFMLVQGMGGLLEVTSGEGDITFSFSLQIPILDDTLSAADTVMPSFSKKATMHLDNNKDSQRLYNQHQTIASELEPLMWAPAHCSKAAAMHAVDSDVTDSNGGSTSNDSLDRISDGCSKDSVEDVSDATTSTTDSGPTTTSSATSAKLSVSSPFESDHCYFSEAPSALPPRILVVDDSPMCQRVLCRILEKNGYIADTADNGQDACDKLIAVEPCVYSAVLMDLRMPIMDGLSATRRIRETPHLARVPVIVVTAELGEEIRMMAYQAGAHDLLSKPAHAGDIMSLLQQYNTVSTKEPTPSSPSSKNKVCTASRKRTLHD